VTERPRLLREYSDGGVSDHKAPPIKVAAESGHGRGSDAGQPLWGLANRLKDLGRLQDLGTLSSGARSRERHRRLALAGVTSVAFRGVGIIVGLVMVPVLLHHLGPEKYGLWVTVTSFAAFLIFSDLGLGQGLVSGISAAEGEARRRSRMRSLVASAFYMLVVVAAFLGAVFAVIYRVVPWDDVLNVSSPSVAQLAGPAVAVLVAMTLVGVPFGLAARVRQGFQESFIANLWMSIGSVVSLAAVLLAITLGATLPWLVFAFACGPLTASLLNGASLFRSRPWLVPRLRDASVTQGRQLLSLGLLFFIVQVAGVAAYQTDNIVVARIIDVAAVTQYAVPMQLFMLIPTVAGVLAYPLWPAYREALARGDDVWFRRTVWRSLVLASGAGFVFSATLALTATPVIQAWAGSSVVPSTSLVIALAIYSTLFTISTVVAMFLYAVDAVRFLAVSSAVFVVVNLGLSIALTRSIGIPGPAWGSVIAMVPNLVAQLVYLRWRMSRGFPAADRDESAVASER
jgi:O-antigen/teichoic acid export membrane protein